MNTPLVSVVMPVYNGGFYLIDAVASIVQQAFTDWQMICVDDGSTDGSGRILEWFSQQDSRIQVVHQDNAGIVSALNRGCSLAAAPLICRMDCDDIAFADRLESQIEFMKSNPKCGAVGGAILEIDSEGDPLCVSRLPGSHHEIVERLLSRQTGLFHPSTMIRAAAFEAVGGYRSGYQWIEDHDLWLRLAQRGQLANTNDVVICYRQHEGSVCWQRSDHQRELMNDLLQEAYRLRNRPVPQQFLLGDKVVRSGAGPGKWARAAAKGGYVRSAYKHAMKLFSSERSRGYKARMAIETALRLAYTYPSRRFTQMLGRSGAGARTVPKFESWHRRWDSERQLEQEVKHDRLAA